MRIFFFSALISEIILLPYVTVKKLFQNHSENVFYLAVILHTTPAYSWSRIFAADWQPAWACQSQMCNLGLKCRSCLGHCITYGLPQTHDTYKVHSAGCGRRSLSNMPHVNSETKCVKTVVMCIIQQFTFCKCQIWSVKIKYCLISQVWYMKIWLNIRCHVLINS